MNVDIDNTYRCIPRKGAHLSRKKRSLRGYGKFLIKLFLSLARARERVPDTEGERRITRRRRIGPRWAVGAAFGRYGAEDRGIPAGGAVEAERAPIRAAEFASFAEVTFYGGGTGVLARPARFTFR
jgi:hypothetical protein